jgi:hypothetical protein
MEMKTPTPSVKTHSAYYAWVGGVAFAFGFTLLIWALGPLLQPFLDILLPDQGAAWYYWKLPARNFWSMFIVWAFYLGHQFAIWATIFWAKNNLKLRTNMTGALTKYNLAALTINVVFVFLHLLQTHFWFDGLAQDVPIWTSQGSVIIMLCVILILENPRRGIFLGRKAGKPFTAQVSGYFRRNHMYLFSWALVYTFWFHPMGYDPQLLSGFFYMFLLFTQMSLAYTKVHLDKRWIILLESYVAIHAFIVAVYNTAFFGSSDMWPMFLTGFVFMFVFTYMYALNIRKEIRWLITVLYLAFVVWLYIPQPIGLGRDLILLMRLEMLWIPIILYALAAVFATFIYLILKMRKNSS